MARLPAAPYARRDAKWRRRGRRSIIDYQPTFEACLRPAGSRHSLVVPTFALARTGSWLGFGAASSVPAARLIRTGCRPFAFDSTLHRPEGRRSVALLRHRSGHWMPAGSIQVRGSRRCKSSVCEPLPSRRDRQTRPPDDALAAMRILIDVQALQSPVAQRGIGRYTAALCRALLEESRGHEMLFSVNGNLPSSIPHVARNLRKVDPAARFYTFATPPMSVPLGARALEVADFILGAHWQSLSPDVVHVSSHFDQESWQVVTPGRSLEMLPFTRTATLYDLIPALFPDEYLQPPELKEHYLRKLDSLHGYSALFAISESARQDAIRVLGIDPDRVFNVQSAVDESFAPAELRDEERLALWSRYGIDRPFVLYTSGPDHRKNNIGLIEAFASMPAPLCAAHQLVIVMALDVPDIKEHLQAAARSAGLSTKQLVLTDRVSDDQLIALYSTCKLFVFPSLYEGFGLPLLEAMRCGAPAVAGNNSSLAEIVGRNDALFDAAAPQSVARVLTAVLSDAARLVDLRRHSIEQAARYTWREVARRTIDAWESLHALAAKSSVRAAVAPATGPTETGARRIPADFSPQAKLLAVVSQVESVCAPRLLVDCTWLSANQAHTGIQRVVRRVLQALPEVARGLYSDVRVVRLVGAVLHSASGLEQELLGRTPPLHNGPIPVCDNDVLLMLDSSWEAYPSYATVFAQVRARAGRIVTVVYDTIPVRHPQFCHPGLPPVFTRWLQLAVLHSDGVMCISRAVREDLSQLIEECGWPHGELGLADFVLGSDLPDAEGGIAQRSALPFEVHGRLFSCVSTLEPRKGHDTLLAAFDRLWEVNTDATLCLVGKQGWNVAALVAAVRGHPEFGRRLIWLDSADDALLQAVYGASDALLFASRSEGFGLGIVEAARFGVPVVCSDIPVFREVARGGARYVPVGDADAWAEAIGQAVAGDRLPDPREVNVIEWRQSAQTLASCVAAGHWELALPCAPDPAAVDAARARSVEQRAQSIFALASNPTAADALVQGALHGGRHLDDAEYVAQAYLLILQRQPDAAGLHAHAKALGEGRLTRKRLVEDLVLSAEFRRRPG
jgi:glycosyltransferase involved in cell wall biosynthesis